MLLPSRKRCNPNQPNKEEKFNQLTEKFNFLFKEVQSIRPEMQDNQLKIEMLENKSNEETIGGRRTNKENNNDRRGMRASICLAITMMKLFVVLR